jgi:hypothetical protein
MIEDQDGNLILSPEEWTIIAERCELLIALMDELGLHGDAPMPPGMLDVLGREVIRRHTARKSGD